MLSIPEKETLEVCFILSFPFAHVAQLKAPRRQIVIYSNLITDLNAAVRVIRNVIFILFFLRLNDFLASTARKKKKCVFGDYH